MKATWCGRWPGRSSRSALETLVKLLVNALQPTRFRF
jgi:hypothetical protein